jgi:hypothetical protein
MAKCGNPSILAYVSGTASNIMLVQKVLLVHGMILRASPAVGAKKSGAKYSRWG